LPGGDRLDLLAHLLDAISKDGAVCFDLLHIPAAADAEQNPLLTWSIEATSFAVWMVSRWMTRQIPSRP
jgi:hypothetical protein